MQTLQRADFEARAMSIVENLRTSETDPTRCLFPLSLCSCLACSLALFVAHASRPFTVQKVCTGGEDVRSLYDARHWQQAGHTVRVYRRALLDRQRQRSGELQGVSTSSRPARSPMRGASPIRRSSLRPSHRSAASRRDERLSTITSEIDPREFQ